VEPSISVTIDGEPVELGSITFHHQSVPKPGGLRYEARVEDYDFMVLLGDQVLNAEENPPSEETSRRVLNGLILFIQWKRISGKVKFWLNTVDRLVISKNSVFFSGVASPHVEGFFNPRIELGGSSLKKTVSAKVFWVPAAQGGRSHLPKGLEYSTVSKWPDQTDEEWLRSAWSVVLKFEESPAKQGSPSSARLGFLADDAPAEWLQPGRKFELYEGRQKVADVQIDV
jgi:hypothetical protein